MSSEQYKNSQKSQGKKSAEEAKQELQKLSDSFEEQKNSYMQKKKNQNKQKQKTPDAAQSFFWYVLVVQL